MIKKIMISMVLCLFAFSSTVLAAPITMFHLESDPGDFVGKGMTWHYDDSNIFETKVFLDDRTDDGIIDSLRIHIDGESLFYTNHDSTWWNFEIDTYNLGTNLATGFYDDAQRARLSDIGHPGLDVSGDGRGLNRLTGNFTIHDIIIDYSQPDPELVKLFATFDQYDADGETGTASGLHGMISYDNEPVPEPGTILLLSAGLIGLVGIRRKKN